MDAIVFDMTPEEHAVYTSCFREHRNGGLAWLLSELSRNGASGAAPRDLPRLGNSRAALSDEAWAFRAAIDVATLAAAFGATAAEIDASPRAFIEVVYEYARAVGRPLKPECVSAVTRDGRCGPVGEWVSPDAVAAMREVLRTTPIWTAMQELLRRTDRPLAALHVFACRLSTSHYEEAGPIG